MGSAIGCGSLRCVSAGRLTTGGPTLPLVVRCKPLLSGLSAICSLEKIPIAEKNGVRQVSLGCPSQKHTKTGRKKKTNLLKFIGVSTSGAEIT